MWNLQYSLRKLSNFMTPKWVYRRCQIIWVVNWLYDVMLIRWKKGTKFFWGYLSCRMSDLMSNIILQTINYCTLCFICCERNLSTDFRITVQWLPLHTDTSGSTVVYRFEYMKSAELYRSQQCYSLYKVN